ncbi:MAG: o-succinylbenzoate synthase [Bacteroidetes bacterium]|nr:o-succinylbenzoate synthase [Bacteroidota bacterium]
MLSARYFPYRLHFKFDAGTSRGVLKYKDSWFIEIWDNDAPEVKGMGECSLIQGLSPDRISDFEPKLKEVCYHINNLDERIHHSLIDFPAIRFGLETARLDLKTGGQKILFPSKFTNGEDSIPINGLIWMGKYHEMLNRIRIKIDTGFRCLKMKIGAIAFDEELKLIQFIRHEFPPDDLELRLDANGAFEPDGAMKKLEQLANYHIHSIEQPIRQRQWEAMAELCRKSPIPIALDEELIGIRSSSELSRMLQFIRPKYIIIKPSLIGGLTVANGFIQTAESNHVNWWVTSALESNIALNTIAQWVYTLKNPLPQGLGTGQLFSNNVDCPLRADQGRLYYQPERSWNQGNISLKT